jgi:hypothetical protein
MSGDDANEFAPIEFFPKDLPVQIRLPAFVVFPELMQYCNPDGVAFS